jgi:L-lactate dehydrogenase complex protein LldG
MSSSDDRESILSRVRGALAPLHERAAMPDYTTELAVMRQMMGSRDALVVFAERLALVNGIALTDPVALVARLRENKWLHGYCDPALWPALAPFFGADFIVETTYDRKRVDDYAFGITRAVGAIAETGTIVLNDATTSRRLGALAPWVHIAVVERAKIFSDLPEAVAGLGPDTNVIWVTGPSKTADVEGILIEGVHGPGVQIALVV